MPMRPLRRRARSLLGVATLAVAALIGRVAPGSGVDASEAGPSPQFLALLRSIQENQWHRDEPSRILSPRPLERSDHRALVGALGWSFIAFVWVFSMCMPWILCWAVWRRKWHVVVPMMGLILLPSCVTIPTMSLQSRRAFTDVLHHWFPTVEVRDARGRLLTAPSLYDPAREATMGSGNWRGSALAEIGPNRPQMMCLHPHGIMGVGLMALAAAKPEVSPCIAPFLASYAPLVKILAKIQGGGQNLCSASYQAMDQRMSQGTSPLAIYPGGFEEATITALGRERVYLKEKAGFIKFALRHGYDLVPVYVHGEVDLFNNAQGGWRWRLALSSMQIPAVLPSGLRFLPLVPMQRPLVVNIGDPLHLPHLESPTKADVAYHHARYVQAIKDLYRRTAKDLGKESRELEVW